MLIWTGGVEGASEGGVNNGGRLGFWRSLRFRQRHMRYVHTFEMLTQCVVRRTQLQVQEAKTASNRWYL